MNVKIVFFFEGVQAAPRYASSAVGWTESWYGTSDITTNLDTWLQHSDVNTYIALRNACLGDQYRLAWVRVSDEANAHSFKIRAVAAGFGSAIGVATTGGEPVGKRSQVNCALLVDLSKLPTSTTDHTHHRKFLMRGLPPDVINGDIVDATAQNWPAIIKFLNWLAKHESGQVTPKPDPKYPPNITIGLRFQNPATVYQPAPTVQSVNTDPRTIQMIGVSLVPGLQYDLVGFPDNVRDLNRRWRCLNVIAAAPPNPASSIMGKTKRAIQAANYIPPGPARYRLFDPRYVLFDEYTIIGLRNKKTGRLFHQLRGRSSNR